MFVEYKYYPNTSLYKRLYPQHEVIGNKLRILISKGYYAPKTGMYLIRFPEFITNVK